MSEMESISNPQDMKISTDIGKVVAEFAKERQEAILAELQPYGALNQGIEYFVAEIINSGKEISLSNNLDKVSVETILKGYIGAKFIEDPVLMAVYQTALERKGIKNFKFLNDIIEITERTQQDLSPENIKKLYFRGEI